MIPSTLHSDSFIPFTDQQLIAMRELYESGKSAKDISAIYGIDPGSVRRRLKIMQVKLRPQGRKQLFDDDQCIKMVILKEKSGLTISSLAARYGCGDRAINEALLRGRSLIDSE